MKNLIFIFFIILSTNLLADGHVKPEEGAFTTLNVGAIDGDKYVIFLRNNQNAKLTAISVTSSELASESQPGLSVSVW